MNTDYQNEIALFAKKHDRDYITPEDVSYFLASSTPENIVKIRLDVLHMIGHKKAEDVSLCAYLAWKG